MRKLIAFVVGGFLLGLALGLYIYNFYVSSFPKASDTEKGLVGLVVLFCVVGGTYIGYSLGKNQRSQKYS